MGTEETTKDTKAFPLRLPREEHEALRALSAVTGTSMNELVLRSVREYLSGAGRREEFSALVDEAADRHRAALDKLAGM